MAEKPPSSFELLKIVAHFIASPFAELYSTASSARSIVLHMMAKFVTKILKRHKII